MTINSRKCASLVVDWYSKSKRDLPWRLNQDPYRIWVSEIMLQQTQVKTVIPYYLRFLASFNSVEVLACAQETVLLKHWEGLGYYNRVRNMQKAAQQIVNEHQGVFPKSYESLLRLQGIGEYTAGAIASIAYDQKIVAVDGNVMRIIARLIEYPNDIKLEKSKKEIQAFVLTFYDYQKAGDLTQAFMELGALVCTFKNPQCLNCPWTSVCLANQHNSQHIYPITLKKTKKTIEIKTVLVLRCGSMFGLIKRNKKDVLNGFYEWINHEGYIDPNSMMEQLRIQAIHIQQLKNRKHVFTHKTWMMDVYAVYCPNQDARFTWFSAETIISEIALPTVFKQIFEEVVCEKTMKNN